MAFCRALHTPSTHPPHILHWHKSDIDAGETTWLPEGVLSRSGFYTGANGDFFMFLSAVAVLEDILE